MSTNTMTINALPAYTYNWLHMNEAHPEQPGIAGEAAITEEVPAQILVEHSDAAGAEGTCEVHEKESAKQFDQADTAGRYTENAADSLLVSRRNAEGRSWNLQEIPTGAGPEVDALAQRSGIPVRRYTAPAGVRVTEDAVRLGFAFDQAQASAEEQSSGLNQVEQGQNADGAPQGRLGRIELHLEADSEMTVVMDFSGDAQAAAVQTKIRAQKGSVLHLVQIQRLGEQTTFINDIGGLCEEGARIELIELVLSGGFAPANGGNDRDITSANGRCDGGIAAASGQTYHGCRIDLAGADSSFDAEIGYLVTGDSTLDINYNARHIAPRTTCNMNASGVLRDRARKLFRGTIDFLRGCAGATGDELEDVLLMDADVVNQTIPLILCAEEDVVGNHGATIGRLDEDLLFYMESRGMERAEIYEMMAQARIDAVVRRIPDAKTREALMRSEAD